MPVVLHLQPEAQGLTEVEQQQEEQLVPMPLQETEITALAEAPVPHLIIEVLELVVLMALHHPLEVVELTEEVQLQDGVQPFIVRRGEAQEITNLLVELHQEAAITEDLPAQEVQAIIEVDLAEEVIEVLVVVLEVIEARAVAEVVAETSVEVPVEAEAQGQCAHHQEVAAAEAQEHRVHHQEVAVDNNISHCFI